MGRKRYFCDYCLKSFAGDPKNRALHLNSVRHIQIRNEYYNNYRDPETILETEISKYTCPYLERGCKFGSNCTYSHYRPDELQRIQDIVEERQRRKQKPLPTFPEWHRTQPQSASYYVSRSRMSYDAEGQDLYSLPVSLRPFDVADYLAADLPDWGD